MGMTFQVAIDAADPHALCDFWAQALHYEVEPADEDFVRRMVAAGHAQESDTLVVKGVLRWRGGRPAPTRTAPVRGCTSRRCRS